MLDEEEFFGPHGIRSVSRWHVDHPYVIVVDGHEHGGGYLPAESETGMLGGNSNWRGPVWFPINLMLIRALLNLYSFLGDSFTVECPTGSGRQLTLYEVARELSDRLTGTSLTRDAGSGRCTAASRLCRKIRIGATCCRSTSTSTVTTGPASVQATRPAGPASWRYFRCSSGTPPRSG